MMGAEVAAARLEGHHLTQQRLGIHQFRRQVQQLTQPIVVEHEAPCRVDHGQPL